MSTKLLVRKPGLRLVGSDDLINIFLLSGNQSRILLASFEVVISPDIQLSRNFTNSLGDLIQLKIVRFLVGLQALKSG